MRKIIKSLRNEENKIINFTKTEKKLFDLLISNINNVVSFSTIETMSGKIKV